LATFFALAGGGGGFLELRPALGLALGAAGLALGAAGLALGADDLPLDASAAGGALVRAGGRIDDLVLAVDAFAEALPFTAVFALLLRPVRSSFSAMLLDPSPQNAANKISASR
jgi:hypothetical protein